VYPKKKLIKKIKNLSQIAVKMKNNILTIKVCFLSEEKKVIKQRKKCIITHQKRINVYQVLTKF